MKPRLILGVIAMATIVVASNILVQFLLGDWLTWGAFTYPLAFLVTDLMNRTYGAKQARKVVLAGFVVGVVCSLIGTQIMLEFGPAVSLRIALASGSAFLLAQMTDVLVFDHLRNRGWWKAPLVSSFIGSTLDTVLFFSIAFAGAFIFLDPSQPNGWAREVFPMFGIGPAAPLWVSLAVADFAVKMSLALVALGPYRIAISRITPARA
ncbi:MAG: queuosine precursor transporter [Rhodobacteraceae bacterium]|nr:queuosine precursor transporter [Paracoccaceae bacterium]